MAALNEKDIGILDDWDEQSKRVINMINIARISIFCSLLIFLAVIHNIRGTEQTLAAYAPMVRNEGWLQIWCTVYGAIIMFSLANPKWQLQPKTRTLPNASAVFDITMMGILTALAGGVTSLEQDDVLGAVVLGRVLELQQLDLQLAFLRLVPVASEEGVVGVFVPPGLDGVAERVDEVLVLAVNVTDGVPLVAHHVDEFTQVLVHAPSLSRRTTRSVPARFFL